ncbi:hypothetical protein [Mycobacterium sp. AZCC_0083]|uniref:hyaluronate lyase N-terminal domain-containing protein n=1 Tax=Mycobacterium sp. AZCC_0083 TaxID=2735882 RepID=UPI0016131887|nr:hypothetical protein [Mycobacterium sp. AZCC_0083]MBB5167195.1 lysophospholipase L1-like esterase [Mycobacterium sp. AZCC_0083]
MTIIRIEPRRGTAAQWTTANPTLGPGEVGYETDTKRTKTGDGVLAWIDLPYSLATPGVRTGIYSFELTKSHASSWPNQPFTNRQLFQLPVAATRMRVHVRNRDHLADVVLTGDITGLSLYYGIPAVDANGEPNGNFTAAPTLIQAPTTLASGGELITPWVDLTQVAVDHRTLMLSTGWTTSASGGMAFSGGLSWQSLLATDAGVQNPVGIARQNNAAWFQMWIEYEYADAGAPRILVVGNSLSNSSSNGTGDNYGTLSSWPQLWAKAQGGVAANLSMSGSWAGHFATDFTRWTVFDSCDTAFDPDVVLYFALASSDTVDSTVADAQANMRGAIKNGKAKYPNARHLITNIPPRMEFSAGASEAKRVAMNTWLHMLPVGTESCMDVDSIVTDWATPGRIRSVFNADDTHFNPRGHQAVSELIPVRRA